MKGIVVRSFVEIIDGDKRSYPEGSMVDAVEKRWIAAGLVRVILEKRPVERAVRNPKERAITGRDRKKAVRKPQETEEVYGAEADHSPGG